MHVFRISIPAPLLCLLLIASSAFGNPTAFGSFENDLTYVGPSLANDNGFQFSWDVTSNFDCADPSCGSSVAVAMPFVPTFGDAFLMFGSNGGSNYGGSVYGGGMAGGSAYGGGMAGGNVYGGGMAGGGMAGGGVYGGSICDGSVYGGSAYGGSAYAGGMAGGSAYRGGMAGGSAYGGGMAGGSAYGGSIYSGGMAGGSAYSGGMAGGSAYSGGMAGGSFDRFPLTPASCLVSTQVSNNLTAQLSTVVIPSSPFTGLSNLDSFAQTFTVPQLVTIQSVPEPLSMLLLGSGLMGLGLFARRRKQ